MLIKNEDCIRHENESDCVVYEYPFNDPDLSVAFAEVVGRYPMTGYVVNKEVKEILYVISGKGKIVIEENEYELSEKDMILIKPKQRYFIEGNLQFVIPCSPAWFPEQHVHGDKLNLLNNKIN